MYKVKTKAGRFNFDSFVVALRAAQFHGGGEVERVGRWFHVNSAGWVSSTSGKGGAKIMRPINKLYAMIMSVFLATCK